MVRLLSLRLALRGDLEAVLLRGQRNDRIHFCLAGVRRGLLCATVRRTVVRSLRRSGRSQVHLSRDDRDHGPVDRDRRHLAQLRLYRGRRAHHSHQPATAAGARIGRRIRWRGYVCRGTCSRRQARFVHELDSDDRNARAVPVAARDPHMSCHPRRCIRCVGLAHPVSGVDSAAGGLRLYPAAAAGVAGVPGDQGGRQTLQSAAE